MSPKRPFFFYSISPFLVALVLLSPFFLTQRRDASAVLLVCGLDVTALLMIGALFDHERFRWFWRAVGACTFIFYAGFLAALVVWGGALRQLLNDPEASAMDALRGLVIFGVPGLLFAIRGQIPWFLGR